MEADLLSTVTREPLAQVESGESRAEQGAECRHCHRPFTPRAPGKPQIFCSAECRRAFHDEPRPTEGAAIKRGQTRTLETLPPLPAQGNGTKNAPAASPAAWHPAPGSAAARHLGLDRTTEAANERALVLAQREITIEHLDDTGEWVIRQKNPPADDAEIFINDEAVNDFLENLTDAMGIVSAP